MTNARELYALAERCEKAVFPCPDDASAAEVVAIRSAICRLTTGRGYDSYSPDHVGSLDAAMTLVPEGHDWLVRNEGDGGFANVSRADATNRTTAWFTNGPRPSDEQLDREGTIQGHRYAHAASAPLALCAAALKAHAQDIGGPSQ